MAWLTSLLKKPAPEPESAAEAPADPVALEITGPSVALLIPDMAGISSFRLSALPDAASATQHIASLRADVRRETHAFWAFHNKPIVDESIHVEALVLIRAETDSDLVYVVSFLDLESALSFTRFEVRRGLYLGNVMIYWAAFAQLREELDGVSITPAFAPQAEDHTVSFEAPAHTPASEPQVRAAKIDVAEDHIATPDVEMPVEADALQAVEEYLRAEKPTRHLATPAIEESVVAEPPVVEDQPTPEQIAAVEPPVVAEPLVAETPVADEAAAVLEPVVEIEDDDLGPLWPESNSAITPVKLEAEPELSSPVAEEQAAIEEAFVFQHKTVESRALFRPTTLETLGEANGLLVDHAPQREITLDYDPSDSLTTRLGAAEPEPGIETIAGDEEGDSSPLASVDPAAGLIAAPKLDDFDVALEVERLLRGRKWEQRDGPFSGFQSPPGRF